MISRLPPGVAGLVARYQETLPARVTRRMIEISGYDRALALAAQAFVALFPMVLALSTIVPPDRRADVLAGGLGLSNQAAADLAEFLVQPAPTGTLTVVSAVLLVVSVLGFARSLQRTYLAAWDLPSRGLWGYGQGLFAAAAIVAEFVLIAAIGPLLAVLSENLLLGFAVRLVVASLAWWPVQRVLVGGRISWRALAPAAVITGVGQSTLILASGVVVPLMFNHQTARYGLAGIGVALVSWLVVLGWLLVVAAVLGAVLDADQHRRGLILGG